MVGNNTIIKNYTYRGLNDSFGFKGLIGWKQERQDENRRIFLYPPATISRSSFCLI